MKALRNAAHVRPFRYGLALIGGDAAPAGSAETEKGGERNQDAREVQARAEHPTRREDRPPNPRHAEQALARDLDVDPDALSGLLD